MNKIAIFEDEFDFIEGAIIAANLKYYASSIKYDVFTTSQHLINFSDIKSYACVIADVELASHSELDGINLIKKIKLEVPEMPVLILSGKSASSIKLKLNELKLSEWQMENIYILTKPISFEGLVKYFNIFFR